MSVGWPWDGLGLDSTYFPYERVEGHSSSSDSSDETDSASASDGVHTLDELASQVVDFLENQSTIDSSITSAAASLFEYAIKNKDFYLLKEYLLKMPKCELHNHLIPDPDTNLQYACKRGLYYNTITKLFEKSVSPHSILASNLSLSKNADYLEQYKMAVKMPRRWSEHSSKHFFNTFRTILSTEMPLELQLINEIKQAMLQNILFMELMVDFNASIVEIQSKPVLHNFTLKKLSEFLEEITPWLSLYSQAWTNKINEYDEQVKKAFNWEHPLGSSSNPILVSFLAEIMRTPSLDSEDSDHALATFFIDTAAGMYLSKNCPNRVVGINIVGPEDNPLAMELFDDQMEIIDFLYHSLGKPNIAIHAGEMTKKETSTLHMLDRLEMAIEKGHAKRIDHGTCIEHASEPSKLIGKMNQKRILVVVCLSSSKKIWNINLAKHPIRTYLKKDANLTLGTDDPHILGTTLTDECQKASKYYSAGLIDFKKWFRNGIEFSFLPGESIFKQKKDQSEQGQFKIRKRFVTLVSTDESKWGPDEKILFQNSLKAQMQIKFEKRFAQFEQCLPTDDQNAPSNLSSSAKWDMAELANSLKS